MYAGVFGIRANITVAGIVSEDGKVLAPKTLKGFSPEFENHAAKCAGALKELLEELQIDRAEIAGIGAALPGLINCHTGSIIKSNYGGWEGADAAQLLARHTGVSAVHCAGHADACAYGELNFGEPSGDFLWLDIGSEIKGSVVCAGQVVQGSRFGAGSFGHIKVDFDHPLHCTCGQSGCVETRATLPAIQSAFTELVMDNPGYRRALTSHHLELDAAACAFLAQDGDAGCLKIFATAGRALGLTLSHACNILNPGEIYIGGAISEYFYLLMPHINSSLRTGCCPDCTGTTVKATALGAHATLLGAAAMVFRKK